MKLDKATARDAVMILLMSACALAVYLHEPAKNDAAQKLQLQKLIPESFGDWTSVTRDTSDYSDEWQSINELMVRDYFLKDPFEIRPYAARVRLILEYSSDLRRNFSFHFPENCHKAGGNHIDYLKPFEIPLSQGKLMKARALFIQGRGNSAEKTDKITAYWLVMQGRPFHEVFFVKLDQMLSGILSQAKQGVLVRVDYEDGLNEEDGRKTAQKKISRFVQDFYDALGNEEKRFVFGI